MPSAQGRANNESAFGAALLGSTQRPAMDSPLASLVEFLGEAPTEAALRSPCSACAAERPAAPSSARRRACDEDSSPETPGLPANDGGFDDCLNDARAPNPEAEPMPVARAVAASTRSDKARQPPPPSGDRSPQHMALPPRAPGEASNDSVLPRGRGGAPSSSQVSSFSKTSTPAPSSLVEVLGEAPAAAAVWHSSGDSTSGSGAAVQNPARPRSGSRPSSGSRQRAGRERSSTPSRGAGTCTGGVAAAVVELDPLGSSSRRRFGGRG